MTQETFWRRCSNCKKSLGFDSAYYNCSVSTCNRKDKSLVFCSPECFSAHLPVMRHREAWAEENRSPSRSTWEQGRAVARETDVPAAAAASNAPPAADKSTPPAAGETEAAVVSLSSQDIPQDVLVVASKLKAYIRARSGMKTSDSVMQALSRQMRRLADDAILRAGEAGRKTVMDRDF
ncbi:MAG: hypothetical protein H8E45_08515 [Proteobacteria bacterium]|nr:hypothetical protein [Pseudomonadota bacterium]